MASQKCKRYHHVLSYEGDRMSLLDAVLAILLCARIHENPDAIRKTALRCAKRLPKRHRHLMNSIAGSPNPMLVARHIQQNL